MDTGEQDRVVVGVDGSDPSLAALRWAVREAGLTGAVVEAVMAWHEPSTYSGMAIATDIDWADNADQALHDALAAVDPAGVEVRPAVVEGHPARVLLDAAAGAQLLVVGNRGHGGFSGMLLGSVSQHVIAHARCPVVTVPHGPATA